MCAELLVWEDNKGVWHLLEVRFVPLAQQFTSNIFSGRVCKQQIQVEQIWKNQKSEVLISPVQISLPYHETRHMPFSALPVFHHPEIQSVEPSVALLSPPTIRVCSVTTHTVKESWWSAPCLLFGFLQPCLFPLCRLVWFVGPTCVCCSTELRGSFITGLSQGVIMSRIGEISTLPCHGMYSNTWQSGRHSSDKGRGEVILTPSL